IKNSMNVSVLYLPFQNLILQMKDFEASAEPLQDSLNATELAVQESSTRLYDLTAKKQELHKLQVLMSKIKQT
uniref:Uncharacterized protein n=1 Tax=Cyprinodon variegatus TaxID=28743 RepID=A0A3Q2DXA9_CYPVA